jgi:hypothetical protein
MGTTDPTLSSCIGATYVITAVPPVANHWYCNQFIGSVDTGYMWAKWDGSALVTSPPAAPVSAPIDLNLNKPIEVFAAEIKVK